MFIISPDKLGVIFVIFAIPLAHDKQTVERIYPQDNFRPKRAKVYLHII